MKNTIEDTYFDTFDEALKIASEQNIFGPYQNLQICYYDGQKQESKYKNLIHLPKNQIVEKLFSLNTRIPTRIVSQNEKLIKQEITKFLDLKNNLYKRNIEEIKSLVIDFSQPLKFYLSIDYGGKVVSNVYKVLNDVIKKMGFEIFCDGNDELTYMDDFKRTESIKKFRPHITININRIRNEFLHDDMFNFIWFQDPTKMLYDDTVFHIRDRDYFFYISLELKNALLNKNIPAYKMFLQHFCTNADIFSNLQLDRKNKVVYIGNNYEFDFLADLFKEENIVTKMRILFNQSKLTYLELQELANEAKIRKIIQSDEHLYIFTFTKIAREETLKWLCSQTNVDVEIYGKGWDSIDELQPYCKGSVDYGVELVDVYNQAKYAFVNHPSYFYQQKLIEASACGCEILLYKDINNVENFDHEDCVLLFENKEQLLDILQANRTSNLNPEKINEDISYDKFIIKMISIVKSTI